MADLQNDHQIMAIIVLPEHGQLTTPERVFATDPRSRSVRALSKWGRAEDH
jgi:hypothetical protein